MSIVFVGVGSNLGVRYKHISSAIAKIKKLPGTKVIKTSSFYETEPVGHSKFKFINCVIQIETGLLPQELLIRLQEIEEFLGRKRIVKWGDRTIDLDILIYDDLIIDEEDLKIPHPLMGDREFVLKGLCEIAPEFVHPVKKKTMKELYK